MIRLAGVMPVLMFLLAHPRPALAVLLVVAVGTAIAVRWLAHNRTVFALGWPRPAANPGRGRAWSYA